MTISTNERARRLFAALGRTPKVVEHRDLDERNADLAKQRVGMFLEVAS